MLSLNQQKGYTLLELLVSLGVSAIVISGVLAVFANFSSHSQSATEIAKLDLELHKVTNLIANDIRRAGFWADADKNLHQGTNKNPFQTGSHDITINSDQNCVLFTYDHDANGKLEPINPNKDDERYGFRLAHNILQIRPWGAPATCNAPTQTWNNLTDPNYINITEFKVSKQENSVDLDGSGPKTATVTVRAVTFSITGALTHQPDLKETITKTITLQNSKFTG